MGQPFKLTNQNQVEHGVTKNSRKHDDFSETVVKKLQPFFRPYNQALVKLLLENRFNVNPHYLLKEFQRY